MFRQTIKILWRCAELLNTQSPETVRQRLLTDLANERKWSQEHRDLARALSRSEPSIPTTLNQTIGALRQAWDSIVELLEKDFTHSHQLGDLRQLGTLLAEESPEPSP